MYFEETITKNSDGLQDKIRVNMPNDISTSERNVALAVEPGNRYSFVIQNFDSLTWRNLATSLTGLLYRAGSSNQYFDVFSGTTGTATATNDRIYLTTSMPFTVELLDGFGSTISDNTGVYPLIILNITDVQTPGIITVSFNNRVNYNTQINPTNFANYIINRFFRINYIERDNQVAYGNTSLGLLSLFTDISTDLLRRAQNYQWVLTTVASFAVFYLNFFNRATKLYIE